MSFYLRTPRMTVRPILDSDRSEFIRVHQRSRAHFEPWMPARDPGESLDAFFNAYVRRAQQEYANRTGVRLVGELPDGRLAGFFSLFHIVRMAFQNAYASWSVSADQTGRGFATEGVSAILDLAFTCEPRGLGLHRVQANIIPENRASIRVAEKLGFRREGTARRYLEIAGQWRDHHLYAKLKEEHNPG